MANLENPSNLYTPIIKYINKTDNNKNTGIFLWKIPQAAKRSIQENQSLLMVNPAGYEDEDEIPKNVIILVWDSNTLERLKLNYNFPRLQIPSHINYWIIGSKNIQSLEISKNNPIRKNEILETFLKKKRESKNISTVKYNNLISFFVDQLKLSSSIKDLLSGVVNIDNTWFVIIPPDETDINMKLTVNLNNLNKTLVKKLIKEEVHKIVRNIETNSTFTSTHEKASRLQIMLGTGSLWNGQYLSKYFEDISSFRYKENGPPVAKISKDKSILELLFGSSIIWSSNDEEFRNITLSFGVKPSNDEWKLKEFSHSFVFSDKSNFKNKITSSSKGTISLDVNSSSITYFGVIAQYPKTSENYILEDCLEINKEIEFTEEDQIYKYFNILVNDNNYIPRSLPSDLSFTSSYTEELLEHECDSKQLEKLVKQIFQFYLSHEIQNIYDKNVKVSNQGLFGRQYSCGDITSPLPSPPLLCKNNTNYNSFSNYF